MWNRRFFKRVQLSDVDIKMQFIFWVVMMILYYINYLTYEQVAIPLMLLNLVDIPTAMLHFFVLLPFTLGNKRLPFLWAFPIWLLGLVALAFADAKIFSFLGEWLRDNMDFFIDLGRKKIDSSGQVLKDQYGKDLHYGEIIQRLDKWRNLPEAIFAMLSYTAVIYASRFNDVNEALEEREKTLAAEKRNAELENERLQQEQLVLKERNERLFLQKQNVDLEYEKLQHKQATKELELEYLKIRIDHHTLFNALDSIYFAAKKKLDVTPNITLKLKELMHYLVREIDAPKILLERDFEVLQHYVDLKKLELEGATVSIQFNLPTEYDRKLRIAPMILLVFIENVFKHGIEKVRENRYGQIDIRLEGQTLFLETVNPNPKRNTTNMGDTEGKGIALTRRRLKNIYPERHEFSRTENKDIFKLNLQIDLDYESN